MDQFVPNNININQVTAPASKSYAQRILLAAALSNKLLEIENSGNCDDVLHIKSIIQQLGAELTDKNNSILVHGRKNEIQNQLNCGESGLGIRLTTTIASTFGKNFTITGKGSLLKRPLTQFKEFLPQMGVNVEFTNNKLPLTVNGVLIGGEYTVDGSLSSQYISGLLMALPLATENSILHVQSPTSLPYIDITLDVLKQFGIKIVNNNYNMYTIAGNQKYDPIKKTIKVEGDWSGAAFWIVYGLIKGKISIKNLNIESTQADIKILEVVKIVGSSYNWENDTLNIIKQNVNPFEFDATNCPDLFPILVVLAASIKGNSTIKGVHRLKHKESDRGFVLQSEFKKLGLFLTIEGDEMKIYGTGNLISGTIESHNDHRIAMAGAIASALTPNGTTIMDANCVNKSYDDFWDIIFN